MREGDLVKRRLSMFRKEKEKIGVLLESETRTCRSSGPLSTKIEHKGKILNFTMPTGGEDNTREGWLVLVDDVVEWWSLHDIILMQGTTHLG